MKRLNADRLGVMASVLCAIHCAVTPVLLFILPSFGRIWAHPASHWGMALFVIPVAALMMRQGYRRHDRKWVVGCGSLGILLVLTGAMLPSLESGKSLSNILSIPLPLLAASEPENCVDACCPSTADVAGKATLQVPPAALVTTLGGIALILTHLGNLCACPPCRRRVAQRTSPGDALTR